MPCYDKKLEASRQDFYDDIYGTRDVDCVLTTGEMEVLMREKGWDLRRGVPGEDDEDEDEDEDAIQAGRESESVPAIPALLTHQGTSSGSYLHTIISSFFSSSPFSHSHFNSRLSFQPPSTPESSLSYPHAQPCPEPEFKLTSTTQRTRSADFEEYVLTSTRTGEVVFRGARCYGFRNLQNLVRRVGRESAAGAAGVGGGVGGKGRGRGRGARVIKARAKRRGAGTGTGAEGEQEQGETEVSREVEREGEGETRTYDYVEVMACPGGCVNGGGQLRPPDTTASERSDGNENENVTMAITKWSDKSWTRSVEQAYWYWHDLPTPPPSPPPLQTIHDQSSIRSTTTATISTPTPTSASASISTPPPNLLPNTSMHPALLAANTLAARVLFDTCFPDSHTSAYTNNVSAWTDTLPASAETLRRKHFRTDYTAVSMNGGGDDVVALQVNW